MAGGSRPASEASQVGRSAPEGDPPETVACESPHTIGVWTGVTSRVGAAEAVRNDRLRSSGSQGCGTITAIDGSARGSEER
jgi:hypothetical protein